MRIIKSLPSVLCVYFTLGGCGWNDTNTDHELKKHNKNASKCIKAQRAAEDMRSLLQDISEMKKRTNAYDFSGVSGYCYGAQLSYMNEIDWDLAEWTGEAYKTVDKLCSDIQKIHYADFSLDYARKTRPNDQGVIKRSERAYTSFWEILDQAENTVNQKIQTSNLRTQEICEQ